MSTQHASGTSPSPSKREGIDQIVIDRLRVSWVWTEALAWSSFTNPRPRSLARLKAETQYVVAYKAARQEQPVKGHALEIPWRTGERQHFWRYYLQEYTKGHPLDAISARRAHRALVPFRFAVPAAVTSPFRDYRLQMEALLHPHGLTLVMTARLRRQRSLTAYVDIVRELQKTRSLEMEAPQGKRSRTVDLEGLGNALFPALRREFFGRRAKAGRRALAPFVIVTVIEGQDIAPDRAVAEGSEVHRALEGLISADPQWRTGQPRPFADADLGVRKISPTSYLLYGSPRGRVVWFPGRFMASKRTHALSCYHRNLTLLSAMLESLSHYAAEAANPVTQQGFPTFEDREYGQRIAGLLGRLAGGVKTTFHSHSSRAHLMRSDHTEAINSLRQYFDMPPLR